MERQFAHDVSRLSLGTVVLSVVLLSSISLVVATFAQPFALALPLAGGAASGVLIWTVDKVQNGIKICIPRTKRCVRTGSN